MVSIFDDAFLPPELLKQIPPLFTSDRSGDDDPMVWAKFVSPITDWTWYVIEVSPYGTDLLFLGWVIGLDKELGTFFLMEMFHEQKAAEIYDLVGESTQTLVDTLNQQFLPAVRFVNANITHAEPSSQEYRMDLAAPEMIRVAKEAYTYQYELQLRKEQDEGDLNRELAGLHEQLSAIRAEIATHQAQIDTAREKEVNRANAYASQLLIEAESAARANAALLEAQALDIRAVLQYELARRRLAVAEALVRQAPRPVIVQGGGDQSAISTLLLAQLLPQLLRRAQEDEKA